MKTKPFAQTLLAWRRKQKLSRVDACALLGVPYRTWQDWELETHRPGEIVQTAIRARLTNVPHGIGRKTLGNPAPKN